jgi:DNA polymerase III epsilon subunit-like protein
LNYELYVVDTETTGTDFTKHSPVEISIIRMSTGEQRTWHIKPINMDTIEPAALKVNHLSMDDLKGLTKEGREKYMEPLKALVEIENWVSEDNKPTMNRLIVAHNAQFDMNMMKWLWAKCDSAETYPFSDRYSLDTMVIAFFLDFAKDNIQDGYSLNALTKRFGIKNTKAHSADADTLATKELFIKLKEHLASMLK